MTIDKGIPIKNIFYMLTYAFKELNREHYKRVETENFGNIHDMFAEILYLGISYLLKQGGIVSMLIAKILFQLCEESLMFGQR